MQNSQSTQPQTANADPSQFGNYSNWAQGEMAKGASSDDLHQVLASHGITDYGQPAPQPQAQTQQPHDSGNWFTHLLPTIGGIGGSILGGIATAGLGGEVVGGAGGSALGQGIENMLEGKNAIQANDLTAGLEGGIGTGIGGVIGKGLGALGGTATRAAENLTTKAGAKEAENAALAEQKVNQAQFGGVNPHVQTGNNLSDNQELLKSWGVDHTSPEAMQNASKGGLFMNDIDQNALAAGSPIKTTDLISSKDITKMTPEESDALAEAGILGPHDTQLPNTVSPVQANKFAQSLNSNMRSIQGTMKNAEASGDYANAKAAKADLQALTQKYNSVQKLASTPEVDATIAARTITREEKEKLVDQYGQAQADHIENAVNSAQSHTDLVKAKLPFAQMNTLSKQALGDQQATATARETARVRSGMTSDVPADTNPSLAQAGLGVVANAHKPVTAALNLAAHTVNNPKILGTLGRIGKLGDSLGTVGGKAVPGLADMAGTALGVGNAQITDPQNSANGTIGGTMQGQPNQSVIGAATSPNGGLSRNDLLTLALYSPTAFSALTTPSASNQQSVSAANTAEQSLSGLGQAPGGGIMSQIGGSLGLGSAGAYQRQAASAAQQVAAALPGSNAKTIESELTNYMAGGANIEDAVKQLMSNLQAVKQNNTNGAYQSLMNYSPSVIGASGVQPQ